MLTNEETRIPVYSGGEQPTNAREVDKITPLAQLNLNWTEKQLPQKNRTKHVHGLHPYLGKYVPQLVEIFLRKYFEPGQTVLDPFVGSGTTLVQANELGIHSIGYDISAFNVLLCKVKTADYDVRQAELEAKDILEKTQNANRPANGQLSLWAEPVNHIEIPPIDSAYLQEWYAPQTLHELLTYRQLIEQGEYQYKDLLKVILTRSARSARLTTHFDLDFPKRPQREPYWCYKHSRTCQPTEEALKFLVRYTTDTIHRIKAFMQVRTDAHVTICHADSREAEVCRADGIITSPPYVGLIDYHDQHAYAYHLLNLSDNSHREIGPAFSGSSERAKRQYQEDMAQVFRNVSQQMAGGSPIIVVAGDRHDLYPEIARLSGLDEEAVLQRHVNRRTGRRSSEFYESIFIWRTP
ncbi:MAG: class I SAM-dependent methyltransferase [Anaerolineae bacterium]|nr:class I SAM-dependent methyltransferase [Anaerolineae bacterium]